MIKLSDFDHLRDNPLVKFKTEVVNGQEVTIVCYMIADSDFWKLPLALETRGIVFDQLGNCISRPFIKFFNVGENDDTQRHNLDFTDAVVVEKRDGSMLIPVRIGQDIFWKSKKSFFSDIAIRAGQCVPDNVTELAIALLDLNYTPIFEFTDPNHRIVIDYGSQPKFVMIAARHVDTGDYLNIDDQQAMCDAYQVECIRQFHDTVDNLLNNLDAMCNFEGYVIRHSNGLWTKAKSSWYVANHRIMTELRQRDVALAVVDETVDDMKAMLTAQGKDLAPIQMIEDAVIYQLESLAIEVKQLCDQMKRCTSRKEAALTYHKHPMFSLAMTEYTGGEPDYKKYWKKQHWKVDYSLQVVYNSSFSTQE